MRATFRAFSSSGRVHRTCFVILLYYISLYYIYSISIILNIVNRILYINHYIVLCCSLSVSNRIVSYRMYRDHLLLF
jgi:hypothetical protein